MRDLGDTLYLTFNTVDASGNAADVTAATVTVTLPDGSTSSPSVAHVAATGVYTATLVATQTGRHYVRWVGTGTNAQVTTDVQDVSPANPNLAISISDARNQLRNWPEQTALSDDRLRDYLAAAFHIIEREVGTIGQTTKTVVHDGGATAILLPTKVSTVTTVTENGVTLTSGDYTADLAAGVLYRGTQQAPLSFRGGSGNVTITYVAGTTFVPSNVRLAAALVVRQLYQVDQQGYRPAYGQPDMSSSPGPIGFAMPKAALELLRATPSMPGFA